MHFQFILKASMIATMIATVVGVVVVTLVLALTKTPELVSSAVMPATATTSTTSTKMAALELVKRDKVEWEERDAISVAKEIRAIEQKLSRRYEKYEKFREWKRNLTTESAAPEPRFFDEEANATRSARFALSPCPLVDERLEALVALTTRCYSPSKLGRVMTQISSDAELLKSVGKLRKIAVAAEAEMEAEAVDVILSAAERKADVFEKLVSRLAAEKKRIDDYDFIFDGRDDDDSYSTDIDSKGRHQQQRRRLRRQRQLQRQLQRQRRPSRLSRGLRKGRQISEHQLRKVRLLHALVVDAPSALKALQPDVFRGHVFKYFVNYVTLVSRELLLLDGLFERDEEGAVEREGSLLGGRRNPLSTKTFAFVGAGFPLTGIFLHVLSDGGKVILIDVDADAVERANKFLDLCAKLGVIDRDAFDVIHEDAEFIEFRPLVEAGEEEEEEENGQQQRRSRATGRLATIVRADILDIASAIPERVTLRLFRRNAARLPIIRKRNVHGISEILYEKFRLPTSEENDAAEGDGGFSEMKLVAQVAPPQKVISGAAEAALVVGFTASRNVNSCQLYVNADRRLR